MSDQPKRIQRKRTKGYRLPDGAVYVGRPTIYGNPFKVGAPHPIHGWPMSAQEAVDLFRHSYSKMDRYDLQHDERLEKLRGKDLACFCRLDQPCHADVLIELSNL